MSALSDLTIKKHSSENDQVQALEWKSEYFINP